MYKKPIVFFVLIFVFCASAFSYGDGHEHDKDIMGLFFDRNYAEELYNSCKDLSDCLCPAVFLALDYCKGKGFEEKGARCRDQLLEYGVLLQNDEMLLICTPGGNSHEAYTHLGWDCDYTNEPIPFKSSENLVFFVEDNWKAWATRKKLLVEAVVRVFDFSNREASLAIGKMDIQKRINPRQWDSYLDTTDIGLIDKITERIMMSSTTKVESLAAVFYYTHILGDIKGNEASTEKTRIGLKTLCVELEKHLNNLFGKKALSKYSYLCNMIQSGTSAEDVLKALQGAFPELLENCSFYKNTNIKRAVDNLL